MRTLMRPLAEVICGSTREEIVTERVGEQKVIISILCGIRLFRHVIRKLALCSQRQKSIIQPMLGKAERTFSYFLNRMKKVKKANIDSEEKEIQKNHAVM